MSLRVRQVVFILGGCSAVALGVAATVQPVLPLVILVACLAGAISVKRPFWLLLSLIVLLPFNGLLTQMAWAQSFSTAYGSLKDATLAALIVAGLLRGGFKNVDRVVLYLAMAVPLFALVSGLANDNVAQALYGWRNNYQPLLLLIAVPLLGLSQEEVRRVYAAVIAMSQVSAVVAITTWTIGLRWLFTTGLLPVPSGSAFPDQYFSAGSLQPRAFSPYVAPNELAASLLVSLAVTIGFPGLRWRHRLILSALPVTAIFLSQSRSGLLGLLLMIGIVTAIMARRSTSGPAPAVLVSGVFMFFAVVLWLQPDHTSDPSFKGHASSFQTGLQLLLGNPLGVGLGEVGPRAIRYTENPILVESFWLLIGIEAGWIVLAMYLLLLMRLLLLATRARAGYIAGLAVASTLVGQIVLPTLQEGALTYLLWVVVALALYQERSEVQPVNDGSAYEGTGRRIMPKRAGFV